MWIRTDYAQKWVHSFVSHVNQCQELCLRHITITLHINVIIIDNRCNFGS